MSTCAILALIALTLLTISRPTNCREISGATVIPGDGKTYCSTASSGFTLRTATLVSRITGKHTSAVLVPRGLVTNDKSYLSNDRFEVWDFDKQLVNTGTFISWPFEHPPRDCLTLLETNTLAHSDCPLSRSCSNVAYHQLDVKWYGKESGLCTGTLLPHVTVFNGTATNRHGTLSTDWGPLYSFVDAGSWTDVYNVLPSLRLLRLPGRDIMFSYGATLNLVALKSDPYKPVTVPVIIQPYYAEGKGQEFCMWVNPPERSRALVIYDGPTLTEWPPFTPVLAVHDLDTYQPPICLDYQPRPDMPLNGHHRVTMGDGDVGRVVPDNPALACAPFKHISSYSVPGSIWLKSMLAFVIESTETVVSAAFRAIITVTHDLIAEFNDRFMLFEISLLAGYVMWYTDSMIRTAVVCGMYALLFGVQRNPAQSP